MKKKGFHTQKTSKNHVFCWESQVCGAPGWLYSRLFYMHPTIWTKTGHTHWFPMAHPRPYRRERRRFLVFDRSPEDLKLLHPTHLQKRVIKMEIWSSIARGVSPRELFVFILCFIGSGTEVRMKYGCVDITKKMRISLDQTLMIKDLRDPCTGYGEGRGSNT